MIRRLAIFILIAAGAPRWRHNIIARRARAMRGHGCTNDYLTDFIAGLIKRYWLIMLAFSWLTRMR